MNYQQAYNDYPTFELLKITKRPGNHPPEAVAAATEILKTRSVTLEDLVQLNLYFRKQDKAEKAKKETPYGLKTASTDFGTLLPDEAVTPPRWLQFLLLLMVLYYAWTLYALVIEAMRLIDCKKCGFLFLRVMSFLPLLYIPVAFHLLFRQKRWGWIILFADNLYRLIWGFISSYSISNDKNLPRSSANDFYLLLIMNALFAFLLWRNSVATHYNVSPAVKKRTFIGTFIGCFLLMILIVVIAVSMSS